MLTYQEKFPTKLYNFYMFFLIFDHIKKLEQTLTFNWELGGRARTYCQYYEF